MKIEASISLGELYDKISILEIKKTHITSLTKLANINNECDQLNEIAINFPIEDDLYLRLKRVNEHLWSIEDDIRKKEKDHKFDDLFIHFARSIYVTNDERSNIKNEINRMYGSEIIEEKSYEKY